MLLRQDGRMWVIRQITSVRRMVNGTPTTPTFLLCSLDGVCNMVKLVNPPILWTSLPLCAKCSTSKCPTVAWAMPMLWRSYDKGIQTSKTIRQNQISTIDNNSLGICRPWMRLCVSLSCFFAMCCLVDSRCCWRNLTVPAFCLLDMGCWCEQILFTLQWCFPIKTAFSLKTIIPNQRPETIKVSVVVPNERMREYG